MVLHETILRENGLSIVSLGLFFLAFIGGQTFSGIASTTVIERNTGCRRWRWRSISAARIS